MAALTACMPRPLRDSRTPHISCPPARPAPPPTHALVASHVCLHAVVQFWLWVGRQLALVAHRRVPQHLVCEIVTWERVVHVLDQPALDVDLSDVRGERDKGQLGGYMSS